MRVFWSWETSCRL